MTPKPKEAKHAQIPWTISEVAFDKKEWTELHNEEDVCLGRGVEIIALVYGKTAEEQKENAALIHKSVNNYSRNQEIKRELLEALIAARPHIGVGYSAIQKHAITAQVDAAIQNARRG